MLAAASAIFAGSMLLGAAERVNAVVKSTYMQNGGGVVGGRILSILYAGFVLILSNSIALALAATMRKPRFSENESTVTLDLQSSGIARFVLR